MSVSNGQDANETTFNNAFMSRTTDTSTTGVVNLNNTTDANSGDEIENTQRAINELFDADGTAGEGDSSRKNYSSNNVVSNGQSRKAAIGSLDAQFDPSTGHSHDGSDSPAVAASDLAEFNNYFAEWQTVTFDSASGNDDDISAAMSGLTSGGASAAAGVITDAPNNRVELRTKDTGLNIEDAGGQKVYGRITESGGTWTLTYYTNEAGTETAHSLSSQDIRIYFRQVFTAETRPTIGADLGAIGSLDLTADIVDASATVAGKMNTGSQTFAGAKTWNAAQQKEVEEVWKEISTPGANPSAGYRKVYAKSDGVYSLDSSGTESQLGVAAGSSVPTGAIFPFAGNSAPTGYLFCDGSAIDRTTYATLFGVIGVLHGQGDGSTTFNLPDLRYKFIRGYGPNTSATGSGSASSNNATFTSHGFTTTGRRVRLTSGSLTGLSAGTDYYLIIVDANTLAFASTRANAFAATKLAISGTNSAVITQNEDPDLSSRTAPATGASTGANVGSVQDDAVQGHFHDSHYGLISASGTARGDPRQGGSNAGPHSKAIKEDDILDHGVPRISNETRPQNILLYYIIKT